MTAPRRPGRRKPSTRLRREISAGGVVVRHGGDEPLFLLIRDSYGHWGFPKGHLERGEASRTAAVREVMEETGLRGLRVVDSIATIEWRFRFRGALIHKRCEFFLMETDSPATKPQRSEGITACRWVPAAQALDLIGYENARGILRQAETLVAGRGTRTVE